MRNDKGYACCSLRRRSGRLVDPKRSVRDSGDDWTFLFGGLLGRDYINTVFSGSVKFCGARNVGSASDRRFHAFPTGEGGIGLWGDGFLENEMYRLIKLLCVPRVDGSRISAEVRHAQNGFEVSARAAKTLFPQN